MAYIKWKYKILPSGVYELAQSVSLEVMLIWMLLDQCSQPWLKLDSSRELQKVAMS